MFQKLKFVLEAVSNVFLMHFGGAHLKLESNLTCKFLLEA